MKAPRMSTTLSYDRNHMPIVAWKYCCRESIKILSELGHTYFKSHEIIRYWHYLLNSGSDKFTNPCKASKYKYGIFFHYYLESLILLLLQNCFRFKNLMIWALKRCSTAQRMNV